MNIVDGNHRLNAGLNLGLKEIPVDFSNKSYSNIDFDANNWYDVLEEKTNERRTAKIDEGNQNEPINNNRGNEIGGRQQDNTTIDTVYKGQQRNNNKSSTEAISSGNSIGDVDNTSFSLTSNEDATSIKTDLTTNNNQVDNLSNRNKKAGYVEEYKSELYENKKNKPLTEKEANLYHDSLSQDENYLKSLDELAGVKEITMHEFRHSNVSLLINEYIKSGQTDTTKFFLMMSDRMGHSIDVMQRTYMHLFPTVQDEIVDLLNNL